MTERRASRFGARCAFAAILLGAALSSAACKQKPEPAPSTPAVTPVVAPMASPLTQGGGLAFVGRQACVKCHADQTKLWQGSHHDRAMEEPTPDSVQGDFEGARFTHAGETVRFLHDADGYRVRVERAGEATRTLPVRYTFGVDPLQQYLIDVGNGRLQALSVAWDSRPKAAGGQRWFHLHGAEKKLPRGDRLHWESPAYSWNTMCADCHSTGVTRGYDPERDSYATKYSEIDVSCEACHGQGSRHVAWAEAGAPKPAPANAALALGGKSSERRWVLADGANIAHLEPGGSAADPELEACAPCHSRRADLGPGKGTGYHDRYRLSLLEARTYFADGQIDDEVFEYGSFLQSKMAARGVVCSDCHEPHSLQLRRPGNALCTGCHRATHYDAPSHHFHAAGTAGSECVSCHMPARTYMVVDPRRDHRLSVPRPALAQKLGAPDACTGCHRDKDAAWADGEIAKRRSGAAPAEWPPGDALWQARQGQPGAAAQLSALVRARDAPPIIRATALAESAAFPSPQLAALLREQARDASPLVRRAAAGAADSLEPRERLEVALPLLTDVARSVRIEAASSLLSAPLDGLDAGQRRALASALAEYKAVRDSNVDRAEALVDLAQLAQLAGDAQQAERLLKTALRKDPSFTAAHLNLADLYRERGKENLARETLLAALPLAAERPPVEHALGLALIRSGERAPGIARLRAAYEAAPADGRFGYVYAIALFDSGSQEAALSVLRQLLQRRPGDPQILSILVDYLRRLGRAEEARGYAAALQGASGAAR